jgi:predicted ATPase
MGVLNMQIEQERLLLPEEEVFLDRAILDALAYYRFLKPPINKKITDALRYSYRKIFILDLLPLAQDYARREDEKDQNEIHSLLIEVYASLGFAVIQVPVLLPDEREGLYLKKITYAIKTI